MKGINQCRTISLAPNKTEQQIKRRYYTIEHMNINDEDDELVFDCHENRKTNEKQLFKRISNLQQPVTKKCKIAKTA